MKKEKGAGFAVAPEAAEVIAIMCIKCLVKTEKALNYKKIF